MYSGISEKIANYLILHFSLNLDKRYKDEQVVRYGIEIILSSMLNLVLLLLLGTFFWGLLETVVFVLFFCPIRQYAGGYHAKTHLRCTLGFLLFYTLLSKFVYMMMNIKMCIIISVLCLFGIYIIAPVETSNKLINADLRIRCRKKIILISCVEIIVFFIFILCSKVRYMQSGVIALLMEIILLVLGWLENRRR